MRGADLSLACDLEDHKKWNIPYYMLNPSGKESDINPKPRKRGALYLLQGLLVCGCCRYSYYGKPVRNKRGEKIDRYAYYRCIGTDAYRFGGTRICANQQMRTDVLECAVWEEVKCLLRHPERIVSEYHKRFNESEKTSLNSTLDSLEKQEQKLKRGISRLIDSYTSEDIMKEEFDPRIKMMKNNLKIIEEQKENHDTLSREFTHV